MNENQTKNNRIVNMRGRKKRTRAISEDKWKHLVSAAFCKKEDKSFLLYDSFGM